MQGKVDGWVGMGRCKRQGRQAVEGGRREGGEGEVGGGKEGWVDGGRGGGREEGKEGEGGTDGRMDWDAADAARRSQGNQCMYSVGMYSVAPACSAGLVLLLLLVSRQQVG